MFLTFRKKNNPYSYRDLVVRLYGQYAKATREDLLKELVRYRAYYEDLHENLKNCTYSQSDIDKQVHQQFVIKQSGLRFNLIERLQNWHNKYFGPQVSDFVRSASIKSNYQIKVDAPNTQRSFKEMIIDLCRAIFNKEI